jgi:hypothetical protein
MRLFSFSRAWARNLRRMIKDRLREQRAKVKVEGGRGNAGGLAMSGLLVLATLFAVVLAYGMVVRFATPRVDPLRESNAAHLQGDRIQIELLNGCGVDNLAADARLFMRDRGFDVVGVGNFEVSDVPETYLIDHIGDGVAARKVASSLGIGADRIRSDQESAALLDVTVVIGHDYRSLRIYADA